MKHILLLCMLFAAVCTAQEKRTVTKDIRYYSDSVYTNDYTKERCVLDINAPVNAANCPVILWFHGGGLTNGNRSCPEDFYKLNKLQPVIVCGIGYRLATKNGCKVKDCLQDSAAGLAWVFNNIRKFGGDPDKIILTGHSAGGYISLMLAMDPRWLAPYGIQPSKLLGIAPMSGQAISHFTYRNEIGMNSKEPLVDDMAPIFHAKNAKNIAPVLLMTGDREKEMLGRYEENALLRRMLLINGHKDVTLLEFQGYGHNMTRPAAVPLVNFVNKLAPPPAAAK